MEGLHKLFHVTGTAFIGYGIFQNRIFGRKGNPPCIVFYIYDDRVEWRIINKFYECIAEARRAGNALAHVNRFEWFRCRQMRDIRHVYCPRYLRI